MSPNILAFTYLILVFRGMGAGVAIMLDNLDPPPPPQEKKEFEKGKTTRFGLAASLVISLGELGEGGGWLQDCRPDPEIHDCFAAQQSDK